MTCNCIAEINEQLKGSGQELDTTTVIRNGAVIARVKIQTRWINGKEQKGKPEPLTPTCCPRCGRLAA
jgi:hypothetical protein